MIDKKRISSLIEESTKIYVNDERSREKYRDNLIMALGNDKQEVISFLINVDEETFSLLDEIYEELSEKFGFEIDDIFCNPEIYRT